MKIFRGLICVVIVFMFCSCSAASETPEISALPSYHVTESANTTIKLSLSFVSDELTVEETKLYQAVMEYMRRHPGVHIDLHYMVNTSSGYTKELIDKISKGTADDIAILNYSFPIQEVAAAATMIDFEELIASDNEVSRTDFFANILDAMKFEGGLYVMPLSVDYASTAIYKEYSSLLDKPLEEYETINYMDMTALYEKVLARQTDGNEIYMHSSRYVSSAVMDALNLQSFDYDTRAVDLYNERTKDLVEKAIRLPLISPIGESRYKSSDFLYSPEIKILFADGNAGNGTYYDCYMGYEDLQYTTPIPKSNFNGDAHFMVYEAAIINQGCNEIETAWDFLKFIMGYDKSNSETDYDPSEALVLYPVQKDLFRDRLTKTFESRYEINLKAGRATPYSKEETIEKALKVIEKHMGFMTKRNQYNDYDFKEIWTEHIMSIYYEDTTIEEMLKALERDLSDLLAKY